MSTIEELREQVDEIDIRIAELLLRRLRTVREIGVVKKSEHIPLVSIDREIEILDRIYDIVNQHGADEQLAAAVEKVYFSIITMSRRMQ